MHVEYDFLPNKACEKVMIRMSIHSSSTTIRRFDQDILDIEMTSKTNRLRHPSFLSFFTAPQTSH
jgi:hypothetical protein